jgi:hypothetical protein
VVDEIEEVELAGEVVRLRSNFQNGVKHLPLRLSPRRSPRRRAAAPPGG